MNPSNHFPLAQSLGSIPFLSRAKSRSISSENRTGEKGKGAMANPTEPNHPARELGRGWKVSPNIKITAGTTFEMANIQGPGAIQHIWMTPTGHWRFLIIRIYWDDSPHPSVECPVGDFFGCGWGKYAQLSSLAVCVNPGSSLNCYWPMPFRKKCRITLENIATEDVLVFYQVDYALHEVPEDAAYFHAQFRRTNPLPYKQVFTILDNVEGWGHYVGTYMCWGVNNTGWWGEGEIKFFMDGDADYPTICGTGTEDYFGGSYNFENPHTHQYQEFCTPYAGLCQVIRPDGVYQSQTRFGLYRWHIMDPIRFEKDLRVTIQSLYWRNGGPFRPGQDDLASVAYWYQSFPFKPFPPLPSKDYLEVV
jgi:Protein of unknown function (DUF2961)